MTKEPEALRLALEALMEHGTAYLGHSKEYQQAIIKSKEALAQPSDSVEQEPVATKTEKGIVLHVGWDDLLAGTKLYTTPPKREWVGLTDEQIDTLLDLAYANDFELVRHIESKIKEINHD